MAEKLSALVTWGLRKAVRRTAASNATTPTVGTATFVATDSSGTPWVRLPGCSFDTPVNGGMTVSARQGDSVSYRIENGRLNVTGNQSDLAAGASSVVIVKEAAQVATKASRKAQSAASTTERYARRIADDLGTNYAHLTDGAIDNATIDVAYVNELDTNYAHIVNGVIDNATIDVEDVNELEGNYAHITNGVIDNATISHADVDGLSANYATINSLNAATGRIGSLEATTADIATLRANSAKVQNLTAAQLEAANAYIAALTAGSVTAQDIIADTAKVHDLTAEQLSAVNGYIETLVSASITAQDLVADHGTIDSLDSNFAHITNGMIDNARISHASVEDLEAHYAQVDLANVSNAWISNGVVRDAAITDAQIVGVSANKITAGTIDASVIRVTNLNADNITTGTINGQRIGAGTVALDRLADDVYTEAEIDNLLQAMSDRIDAAIETYTGPDVPTLSNYPASGWTTADLRAEHVGDVYYVVNAASSANGYSYRFAYDSSTGAYSWVLITDSDVTATLQRLIAAEGDISGLKEFRTSTTRWATATDAEVSSLISAQTTMSAVLNRAIVRTTQLWCTRPDTTAPLAPTHAVQREPDHLVDASGNRLVTDRGGLILVCVTDDAGNTWTTNVPAYDPERPHYFYCYQHERSDGTYTWSEVTYDGAVSVSQMVANSASDGLAAYITSNDEAVASLREQVDGQIDVWYLTADPTTSTLPASAWTTDDERAAHDGDLCFNTTSGHCWRWAHEQGSYGWVRIPDSDAAAALLAAQGAQATADGKRRIFATTPTTPYDVGDLWVTGSEVRYATTARETGSYVAADWALTATDDTAADAAQATADKNVRSSTQLWHTKADATPPAAPTAEVTSDSTAGGAWRTVVPTYSSSYPHYFYCWQYELADGTYDWSAVTYDRATTENQANARDALSQVSTKVETSTFNELSQTVSTNSATITTLSQTVDTKADGSTVTTLSNTVSAVQQTANGNSSKLSNLTTRLGTNADGTAADSDIVSRHSTLAQTVDGLSSTVSSMEQTVGSQGSRLTSAESAIEQNTSAIALRATVDVVEGIGARAEAALEAADVMRYEHTFTKVDGTYRFEARLYRGSEDITSECDPDRFVWYLRGEDGDSLWSRGTTMLISEEQAGYRATVIGGYEDAGSFVDAHIVTHGGDAIVTDSGERLSARVIWED